MINGVNYVNSKYENTVETSQAQSTTKVDDEQSVKKQDIEEKVNSQVAEIKDTVEISETVKGLDEETIRSMRDAMDSNKSLLLKFIPSAKSTYKSGMGVSTEDFTALVDAYNTQRYLGKNAFKMYFEKNGGMSKDIEEISDLKSQIEDLTKQINDAEKTGKDTKDVTSKKDVKDKKDAEDKKDVKPEKAAEDKK